MWQEDNACACVRERERERERERKGMCVCVCDCIEFKTHPNIGRPMWQEDKVTVFVYV
jgi:hypothetical protein